MKNLIFASFLLILLTAPTAQAAPSCYSKIEAEADQGIRIHSELMVIGLNCQVIGKRYGDDLYGTYRKYTAKHAKLYVGYEETLMAFFKKKGSKNALADLNELRTRYANKISDEAAKMRPDIFCSRYATRVKKASVMTEDEIRKWSGTIYPSHPVSYPVCKSAQ